MSPRSVHCQQGGTKRVPFARMPMQLPYAVITPARNERRNLQRLFTSLANQESPPREWMIVVDAGSDDGTMEVAQEMAARHSWINVERFEPERNGSLVSGRREGRALDSFRLGVRKLNAEVDVVVKQDADTSFDRDYFKRLLERFSADPRLGIAGGACLELEGGHWKRRKVIASHPRGASRAYRADCLEHNVMGLDARMGWDGLDEIRAALAGYETRSFVDLHFRHHRVVGAREGSRFRHGTAQGRASWYMGYRPSYLFLRALYRWPEDRSAIGLVCGYLAAALRREPRCGDTAAIRYLRDQQRLSRVIRRGAPP